MTYFDDYKKRVTATGENHREAFKSASTVAIHEGFRDSPAYVLALVDGVPTDTILQNDAGIGVHSYNRMIIFPPSYTTSRGVTVRFDNQDWLLLEFDANPLYPRGRLQKCNQIIKVAVGATTKDYPCYTSSLVFDKEMNHIMTLPRDEFVVILRYDANTKVIKENDRFMIGAKAYAVVAIDDLSTVMDGAGILRLHIKSDVARSTDDPTNKVADNTKPAPSGGKLW